MRRRSTDCANTWKPARSMSRRLLVFVSVVWVVLVTADAGARAQVQADRVRDLIARGHDLEQRGDPTSAIAFYRDAVAAGPRDPRGYGALGACYLALEEWSRAREVFEAGIAAAGRDAELWWGLFEAQQKLGKPEAALRALRELLARAPLDERALRALVELSGELGAFHAALAATRTLVSLTHEGPELASLKLRARALELILGAAERTRARPCQDGSAVLSALARCP